MKGNIYSSAKSQSEAVDQASTKTQFKVLNDSITSSVKGIKDYVQSRGENLITNGNGLLGDNTNFSGWTFDSTQVFGGAGSMFTSEQNAMLLNDEMIPVKSTDSYKFSLMAKSKTGLGRHYFMFACHDIDGYSITPYMAFGYNKPIVSLAAELKVGDTTITLSAVDGFIDDSFGESGGHKHSIIFWGYKNLKNYTYPDGTYSRYVADAMWNNGAINRTTKVITLNKPWALPNPKDPQGVWRVGQKVSSTQSGASFNYVGAVNELVPTTWKNYEAIISGTGLNLDNFMPGTAFIKVGALPNRTIDGGAAGDNLWMNSIELFNVSEPQKLKEYTDSEIKLTKDAINLTVSKAISGVRVRYIRDWLNGSTSNTGSHWVQIQAFKDGVNIALSKTVTGSSSQSASPYGFVNITNGNLTTGNYGSTTGQGAQWVQVDLGAVVSDIDYVTTYHYFGDGRRYYETKTEVSEDGVTWFPIFDSAASGEYAETSTGNKIYVNPNHALSTAESSIKASADKISLVVKSDDTIDGKAVASSINQTANDIKIAASKINIEGAVKFSSFDSTARGSLVDASSPENIFPNGKFEDWESTVPNGWTRWTGSGSLFKSPAALTHGFSPRFTVTGAQDDGLMFILNGKPENQYYMVEFGFMLESGTGAGAGLLLRHHNATNGGGSYQEVKVGIQNYIPSPVIGKWYTIKTFVEIPKYGGTTSYTGFLMANYVDLAGGRSAKVISFDKVLWRPATETEIQSNNKWVAKKYNVGAQVNASYEPTFEMLSRFTPSEFKSVSDATSFVNIFTGDYYIVHYATSVFVPQDKTVTLPAVTADDTVAVYVNGTKAGFTIGTTPASVPLVLKAGWNNIDVLMYEHAGGESVAFGLKISDYVLLMQSEQNPAARGSITSEGVSKAFGSVTGIEAGVTKIDGGKIITNSVTANQIAAKTITSAHIASNSIRAENLFIGDMTNMMQLDENAQVVTRTVVTHTDNLKYFKVGPGSWMGIQLASSEKIEFKVNDSYLLSFAGFKESAITGAINFIVRYYYTDGSSTNASITGIPFTTSVSNLEIIAKITAAPTTGKTIGYVSFFVEKDGTTSGHFYMRNVELRKMYAGKMIVDGTIDASKVSIKTLGAGQDVAIDSAGITATRGTQKVLMNSTDGFAIKNGTTNMFTVDTAGVVTAANFRMNSGSVPGPSVGLGIVAGNINTGTLDAGVVTISTVTGANDVVINAAGLTATRGTVTTVMNSTDGFAIKNSGVATFSAGSDGTITANKLNLSGSASSINIGGSGVLINSAGLTATRGTVTVALNATDGFVIKNSGVATFSAASDGAITASKMTLNGASTISIGNGVVINTAGLVATGSVNGKSVVTTLNSANGFKIAVAGTTVFSVDSTGSLSTQNIVMDGGSIVGSTFYTSFTSTDFENRPTNAAMNLSGQGLLLTSDLVTPIQYSPSYETDVDSGYISAKKIVGGIGQTVARITPYGVDVVGYGDKMMTDFKLMGDGYGVTTLHSAGQLILSSGTKVDLKLPHGVVSATSNQAAGVGASNNESLISLIPNDNTNAGIMMFGRKDSIGIHDRMTSYTFIRYRPDAGANALELTGKNSILLASPLITINPTSLNITPIDMVVTGVYTIFNMSNYMTLQAKNKFDVNVADADGKSINIISIDGTKDTTGVWVDIGGGSRTILTAGESNVNPEVHLGMGASSESLILEANGKLHLIWDTNTGFSKTSTAITMEGNSYAVVGEGELFRPLRNDRVHLGGTSYRWKTVWAVTTTINSDSRSKHDIQYLRGDRWDESGFTTRLADKPLSSNRAGEVYDFMKQMPLYQFKYDNLKENEHQHQFGFIADQLIAHDTNKVADFFIAVPEKKEDMMSVSTQSYAAAIHMTLQQEIERNDTLEKEVKSLRRLLTKIQKQLKEGA